MDMGVDHAGKHGRRTQVEHPCTGRKLHGTDTADVCNAVAGDKHDLSVLDVSWPRVEQVASANRYNLILRRKVFPNSLRPQGLICHPRDHSGGHNSQFALPTHGVLPHRELLVLEME